MAMVNPNMSNGTAADYKWNRGVPTKESCDPNNPKEMYLWALVALPGQNGGPLVMPVEYLMMVSEHLYECFGPPNPEGVQLKKYLPPSGQERNWATAPGRWVAADAPEPPRQPAKDAWHGLEMLQKADLVSAMFDDENFWERLPKPLKEKLRRVADDPT